MTESQKIAQTILSQLGGNKFQAMTGAGSFASGDDSLSFRFRTAPKNRARACVVKLKLNDTYTVKFYKMKGFDVELVGKVTDVYAEMLASVFAEATGLAVRL